MCITNRELPSEYLHLSCQVHVPQPRTGAELCPGPGNCCRATAHGFEDLPRGQTRRLSIEIQPPLVESHSPAVSNIQK